MNMQNHKSGLTSTLAGWKDTRTPITEFLQPVDALLENDYTIHPAMYEEGNERTALDSQRIRSKTSKDDGWVDTLVENFADGLVPDNEYECKSFADVPPHTFIA